MTSVATTAFDSLFGDGRHGSSRPEHQPFRKGDRVRINALRPSMEGRVGTLLSADEILEIVFDDDPKTMYSALRRETDRLG